MKQNFDHIFKDEYNLLDIKNLYDLEKQSPTNYLLGKVVVCKNSKTDLLQNREYVIYAVYEVENIFGLSRFLYIEVIDKQSGKVMPKKYKPSDFYNHSEYIDKILNETEF